MLQFTIILDNITFPPVSADRQTVVPAAGICDPVHHPPARTRPRLRQSPGYRAAQRYQRVSAPGRSWPEGSETTEKQTFTTLFIQQLQAFTDVLRNYRRTERIAPSPTSVAAFCLCCQSSLVHPRDHHGQEREQQPRLNQENGGKHQTVERRPGRQRCQN